MELDAIVEDINTVPEAFRSLYTERNGKFEITAIKGMKTQADVDRIQAGLTKERNDHKATKEKLAKYGDLDPVKVQEQLDRIPELEAAASGKIDETKMNELVEGRVRTRLAPVERELKTVKGQLDEANNTITEFRGKETRRTIQDEVRAAAKKANLLDSAVEDALLLGERIFEVTEEGRVVARDGVGVTPGLDAVGWMSEMQSKRPHWWGPSAGGGAGGNQGNKSGVNNPWSHENWNLTEQGRLYRENPERAKKMAESAGTMIGGSRPQAKGK